MKLNFDTEGTCNCPDKGISTREECWECRYYKMRFENLLGGRTLVELCRHKELYREPDDLFVGVK